MSVQRIDTNPHIQAFTIKSHQIFPNSKLPVLIYQRALLLPKQKHKACEIIQHLVWHNGWSNTWRNGIYDFHHYHSNTHECMLIAMGWAKVMLGGPGGRTRLSRAGDVIILPAGTAHRCISSSTDFLCVGAYPQGRNYDILIGQQGELQAALKRMGKVSIPKADPVFGKEGFLKTYWSKKK